MNKNKTICQKALEHFSKDVETRGSMYLIDTIKLLVESEHFLNSLGIRGSFKDIAEGIPLYSIDGVVERSNDLYYYINPKQRIILFLKDAIKAGY